MQEGGRWGLIERGRKMSPELISQRAARRNHDFAEKKFSVEQTKRQRVLSPKALSWFALKHYPSIFFDQRLRSRLFR